MLGSPKNVFWQALFLTVVVFFFGLLIGYAIESGRVQGVNEYYLQSEISLMDIFALNNFAVMENASCDVLIKSNLEFADKVYVEAKILDKYEGAGRLSENIKLVHKKYDLLRIFLWMNAIKAREVCEGNFISVIYLYEREIDDLAQKATQAVWSRILLDFKEKRGDELVLIPIAVDSELSSLDAMTENYEIKKYPIVILNDVVIHDLKSVEELEVYLK
jgi:hypothetical protein